MIFHRSSLTWDSHTEFCGTVYLHVIVIGPWNGLVWKGPQRSFSSTSCYGQGIFYLDQVAQTPSSPEHPQGWGTHSFCSLEWFFTMFSMHTLFLSIFCFIFKHTLPASRFFTGLTSEYPLHRSSGLLISFRVLWELPNPPRNACAVQRDIKPEPKCHQELSEGWHCSSSPVPLCPLPPLPGGGDSLIPQPARKQEEKRDKKQLQLFETVPLNTRNLRGKKSTACL